MSFILQIAAGVMVGLLGYHFLAKTIAGRYVLIGIGSILLFAVVLLAGWALWLWQGESIVAGAEGAAVLMIALVAAVGLLVGIEWWASRWLRWTMREKIGACFLGSALLLAANAMYVAVQPLEDRPAAWAQVLGISVGSIILVALLRLLLNKAKAHQ